MKRRLIDVLTAFFGWVNKGQRVSPVAGSVTKVNLGSGLCVTDGWINIDCSLNALFSRWPAPVLRILYHFSGSRNHCSGSQYTSLLKRHRFIHHNLKYGVPFPDDSIDYAYSWHFLEHYKHEAEHLLKDIHRALRKRGILRIGVPDLRNGIDLYLRGEKEKALAYFFEDCFNGEGHLAYHRYAYDFDVLSNMLLRSGFSHTEKCAYKEGKTPDIDMLEGRSEGTLFVEARK